MSNSDPLLWRKPPLVWRYGIAALAVTAALIVSRLPLFHLQTAPVSLFLCAVMVSAWLGGFRPGLFATVLSILAFDYYFLEPAHSLAVKPDEIPRAVVFLLSALFVGTLSAAQRSSTESLRRTRDDLKETVQELEKANAVLQAESGERKRAEDELQRSQAYLAEAQRLSNTGSFGWKVSTGEILWSEETFRIFQYDRATTPTVELILRRVHPEDAALVRQTIERASQEGKDFDLEHRLLMPDGSVKHVHVVARALSDESGSIEFVGAVMDVTAAKEAEKTLRESEAYLAEAQKLSHTGSWAWAPATGEIRYCSEECYRVLGFDPQGGQPRFETFFERIHPDDQPRVVKTLERATRECVEFELDDQIVYPGGEIRDVHVVGRPVLSPSGDLVEFVGTLMDVTERRRAESLRDGENRILEMIAGDAPLAEILEKLILVVEAQFAGVLCSVLLLDEDGRHARHGAAPSLPKPYSEAIDGMCIGPKAGSYGTAMYRREPVVVTDILQDPLWEPYRVIAEPYGFRACWSTAILAHSGKVLGSFAMYSREPHGPSPAENRALDMATHLAGIAIERKLTHEQLERSQAYLAEAQGLSHTGSFGWKPSTGEIIWSEETFRIFQYDRTTTPTVELILQRVHPSDVILVRQAVERASHDEKNFEHEYRLLMPDGSVKHVHVVARALSDESGGVEFVGAVMDVTAAKQVEQTLRENKAYLAEAQRLTHTGSWAWNVASRENVHWSQEQYRLFGLDPESDSPSFDVAYRRIHPEDRSTFDNAVERAIREKSDFEVDFRTVLPDGSTKYLRSVGHPVFSASGELVEFVGTGMDITERTQAEEERERLRKLEADLAHISRVTTMGELTASLAHEVNQPIAAAVTDANTCLRWLMRDQPDLEEARAAASRIVKDATRAAEIVSRVRLLFRKGAPQRELVDVNELIRELIVLLRSEATRYSVALRTELAADLPQLIGDGVQLQQVMMNLILNSIDAMKEVDGTRELAIKSERADNEQLMVSISDTGIGLPPQQTDQIFNAFFTTKPHGTGMGLRISRSIVESHGGRLWASDNFPRGASFFFTLPTKAEAQE